MRRTYACARLPLRFKESSQRRQRCVNNHQNALRTFAVTRVHANASHEQRTARKRQRAAQRPTMSRALNHTTGEMNCLLSSSLPEVLELEEYVTGTWGGATVAQGREKNGRATGMAEGCTRHSINT